MRASAMLPLSGTVYVVVVRMYVINLCRFYCMCEIFSPQKETICSLRNILTRGVSITHTHFSIYVVRYVM